MNLEQSNSFMEEEEKNKRRKKGVLVSIAICGILIVLLMILIFTIQYQDSLTLKMFIDGKETSISSTLLKEVDEKIYINVKEISQIAGYTYTKGEYGKYNEDEKSCYLTNDYEIVALTSDLNSFVKYSEFTAVEPIIAEIEVVAKSENGQSQKYALSSPVQYIDNAIYVPFEALPDLLNMQVNTSEKNRIKLYTLEKIVASGIKKISKLEYSAMSNEYENLKAMVYNYAVVGNGTYYGVISLETGQQIISFKYDDITFLQNLKNFQIKASNTVGILGEDGSTVIKPTEYDEISIYDDENLLYLVKKDGKYGILNKNGEVIVYADYDEIGYSRIINMELPEDSGNYKILFDKCIPVKEGIKYGLFDIEGNELLGTSYDELMYTQYEDSSTTSSNAERPVCVIPESLGIKGIVINQNESYGIYDVEAGSIIVPCVCTKIYSITKASKTTYYLEYEGQTIELEGYLESNNLKSIKENSNMTSETNTLEEQNVTSTEATEQ